MLLLEGASLSRPGDTCRHLCPPSTHVHKLVLNLQIRVMRIAELAALQSRDLLFFVYGDELSALVVHTPSDLNIRFLGKGHALVSGLTSKKRLCIVAFPLLYSITRSNEIGSSMPRKGGISCAMLHLDSPLPGAGRAVA